MNLPIELLQEALSSLSLPDLARCARVNRVIGESALNILYRDIDLNIFNDPDDEEETKNSFERQRNLLNTLAK